MKHRCAHALEIAALALLPAAAVGLLLFLFQESFVSIFSLAIAAEALPWLLLSLAVPLSIPAVVWAGLLLVQRRERAHEREADEIFSSR
jgi:predicted membrane-bound mannosyltransferase